MRLIYYIIATGFGLGYSPIAPGTAGSILGVLVAFFLFKGNTIFLFVFLVVALVFGTIASSYVEKDRKSKDPSLVVIDEVAGMWISLLFIPHLWWTFLIAFGLFRLFDVFKPFPANKIQNWNGGLGIVLDDVIAGIYALAGIHLILLFISI
jgi:phosphatidylglycerophosphatase A